ncbi:chondroitin AC/alginate lyase [Amylostereum chailletii]|nr:chondroitin AC/alginate lyase [Amylostereum chailletii]
MAFCHTFHSLLFLLVGLCAGVLSFEDYFNEFIDPSYILGGNFPNTTIAAQRSIVQWADELTAQGPWSVITSKPFNAPSGDPHDYLSWAPYWWDNCSDTGNKTELTSKQIYTTCKYVRKDGQFSPDVHLVNNTGAFTALADAVFYNALAWALNGSDAYASNAASFLRTWFVDPATKMNPNLDYAQIIRGPGNDHGTQTGVLDLRCMAKIATGILVLRQGQSKAWTSVLDAAIVSWSRKYIHWLETSPIALGEALAANNHGTFYYNQLAALKLIVYDTNGAKNVTRHYFENQYQKQIEASGEQVRYYLSPLEAERTRPYHYRGFNIAAIITNAQIAAYSGFPTWDLTSASGATIRTALDFVIAQPANGEPLSEIHPYVAAVAAVYGDPQNKYASFLKGQNPDYPEEPYFLFAQPMSDEGWAAANGKKGGGTTEGGAGAGTTTSASTNGAGVRVHRGSVWVIAAAVGAMLWSLAFR